MRNNFQIIIIIVSLIVINILYVSRLNSAYAQEAQKSSLGEPNRNDSLKIIKEQLESQIKQLNQEHAEEFNKSRLVYPNDIEIEKIITRQIEANNIRFKDRLFGNPFKGLAISIESTKEEYELGKKIEISLLLKNFSKEKIELKHERGYGDIDEFRYAMYFPDGNAVPKSELIEKYDANNKNPEIYSGVSSTTTQIFEPMRLWDYVVEIGRFFRIEKEGIYTIVIMRRITNSWNDGFMISNMIKINIVKKNEEQN